MTRPRALIVAHDAGGAEILSAWLRHHPDKWNATLVLEGPAVNIFARKLGVQVRSHNHLPPLDEVTFVLCGSSATAQLERRAVRAARAAAVRCAVWLDHWSNYRLRFIAEGKLVLPDEIWVTDEHAESIARAELPGADIRVRGNPYLEDFAAEVNRLDAASSSHRRGPGAREHILFVTEPISSAAVRATGNARGWGYTEFDALRRYLHHLAQRDDEPPELRVRPHPSESSNKYDALLAAFAGTIAPQRSRPRETLAADVAWADTVVGCNTMALVAALAADRRVISVLPRGAPGVSLPHSEIERPFALLNSY